MKNLKEKIGKNKSLILNLIIAIIITYTLMNLPSIFEGGVTSDWIGFWGNLVGSFLGVVGAIIVVKYQMREEKKKDIEAKEPLLVLGIAKYENVPLNWGTDLVPNGLYFHDLNRFSEVSVPLINGGESPIFDISYYFEIENVKELKKVYSKANTFADMVPKAFFEEHNMKDPKANHPIKWYEFKYLYEYELDGKMTSRRVSEKILTYNDFISVIMPGKEAELKITKFISMIWSYYFIASFLYSTNEQDALLPKVKVIVQYKDYELKKRSASFYIELGAHGTQRGNLRYTLISARIE